MRGIKKYLFVCLFSLISIISFNKMDVSASEQIIRGADIGWLSQLEDEGISWVDDEGEQQDALLLLKEKGINAVRLRVFVDPSEDFTWTKPDGTVCKLGYRCYSYRHRML